MVAPMMGPSLSERVPFSLDVCCVAAAVEIISVTDSFVAKELTENNNIVERHTIDCFSIFCRNKSFENGE